MKNKVNRFMQIYQKSLDKTDNILTNEFNKNFKLIVRNKKHTLIIES